MRQLKDYICEGLFSAFKIQAQITKAQGQVFDYFEDHADEYKNEYDIARDLEKIAHQAYKENVKEPGAMSFNQWFRDFEKSFMNYIKRIKK